jgi:beta-glucosidase
MLFRTYARELSGPDGVRTPPKDSEFTSSQVDYYRQALEATSRYAAQNVKFPIYVTENGISTDDDTHCLRPERRGRHAHLPRGRH